MLHDPQIRRVESPAAVFVVAQPMGRRRAVIRPAQLRDTGA